VSQCLHRQTRCRRTCCVCSSNLENTYFFAKGRPSGRPFSCALTDHAQDITTIVLLPTGHAKTAFRRTPDSWVRFVIFILMVDDKQLSPPKHLDITDCFYEILQKKSSCLFFFWTFRAPNGKTNVVDLCYVVQEELLRIHSTRIKTWCLMFIPSRKMKNGSQYYFQLRRQCGSS